MVMIKSLNKEFEVIVIGGGHAGCEAASASARMGVKTLLITQDLNKIGEMSCNPAIGGIGKGHLVREIDALDGLMGKVADKAGIQFRLLNRSRGAAVRGPRCQADRKLYRQAMQKEIFSQENLTAISGTVISLIKKFFVKFSKSTSFFDSFFLGTGFNGFSSSNLETKYIPIKSS